jgi:tRNA-Thr(GGU) m(6)t(6)A37 methyltransferase TsaA
MHIIARIHNDFPTKFGQPRQGGLVNELRSMIVFEPEYRVPEALRGIEGYSHLWLIWQFHQAEQEGWSPTVRPPRLGGNARMGVFATRSPFRPNPVGLSNVRLEEVRREKGLGTVLIVSGADLMDGTPIYDIKPYLPYADCHPEATGGFAHEVKDHALRVVVPEVMMAKIPEDKQAALRGVLAQDPRPGYQRDPDRTYGFSYADMEVRFRVAEDVLTVTEIITKEE